LKKLNCKPKNENLNNSNKKLSWKPANRIEQVLGIEDKVEILEQLDKEKEKY
jgi:hypothetical protein